MSERHIIVVGVRDAPARAVLRYLERNISLLGWQPDILGSPRPERISPGDRPALAEGRVAATIPEGRRAKTSHRNARSVTLTSQLVDDRYRGPGKLERGGADCLRIGVYANCVAADEMSESSYSASSSTSAVEQECHLDEARQEFGADNWLSNCDEVIDVSFDNVRSLSVEIFAIVRAWLTDDVPRRHPHDNRLPRRARISGKGIAAVLDEAELVSLLDQAASHARKHRTFIVQGGNGYISSFLRQLRLDCRDIKLTCISKTPLSTLVYSMLDPSDRAMTLRPEQRDELLSWRGLSERFGAFRSTTDLTVGDAALILAGHAVPVPFSYPADDRRIRIEFRKAVEMLADRGDRDLFGIDEASVMVGTILRHTRFSSWLQRDGQDLLFIDDTLYRGRTFYTAGLLARLLSRGERWKFLTLTADRVARSVEDSRLIIGNRQRLYPYENSMSTEGGYWDLCGCEYIWRDLATYSIFLSRYLTIAWVDPISIRAAWRQMMAVTIGPVRYRTDNREMIFALFEFAIACAVDGRDVDVESLVDQRARGLGYSAAFANIMLRWIAQEEPRWKRQHYKDWIAGVVEWVAALICDHDRSGSLLRYYGENIIALEYSLLSSCIEIIDGEA